VARRRLALETREGRLVVRDLEHPDAALVDIDLPDGRQARVAGHLCGWTSHAGADPLWPSRCDAERALTDDDGTWAATMESAAAMLWPPPAAPLPGEEAARLAALKAAHPGLWIDGPHPHPDGGWYVVLAGASDLGSALGRGHTPQAAARDALAAAEGV